MERTIYRCLGKLSLLFFLLAIISSCDGIEEPDVSNESIILLTPPDNHVSADFSISFKWQDIPDADFYRIQIATPNFENPIEYLVDSLLPTAEIQFTLESASYQWRVRAENVNSRSIYTTRNLSIDASDISNQDVILSSPQDFFVTNTTDVAFSWQELPIVDSYQFQLFENDNGGVGAAVGDPVETFTNSLTTSLSEGSYWWSIAGIAGENTTNIAYRRITIDTTVPEIPVLLSPGEGEFISSESFNFSWTAGTEQLTTTTDSLLVFADSSLSQPLFEVESTGSSQTLTLDSLDPATYYWIVSRRDEAGNFIDSSTRSFVIQ